MVFRHTDIVSQSANVPFRRPSDPETVCMANSITPSAGASMDRLGGIVL